MIRTNGEAIYIGIGAPGFTTGAPHRRCDTPSFIPFPFDVIIYGVACNFSSHFRRNCERSCAPVCTCSTVGISTCTAPCVCDPQFDPKRHFPARYPRRLARNERISRGRQLLDDCKSSCRIFTSDGHAERVTAPCTSLASESVRINRISKPFSRVHFVEDIFCFLLAQTFGYREMNFQCRVLYTQSPLESAHGQTQLQFCTRSENTFSKFGPSKGHRVHKYYAYCNSVKSLLIYVVFQE